MGIIATGTCTITRLRNGDMLYATINCSGANVILYNESSLVTQFSAASPLVFTPNIYSQNGSAVTINSMKWYKDGTELASTDGTQYYKVTDTDAATPVTGKIRSLSIISNSFADYSNPKTHVFQMIAEVTCGGSAVTVQRQVSIEMIRDSVNAYIGKVYSTDTQIDIESETLTINQQLYHGNLLTYGVDYKVLWYKNNNTEPISTAGSDKLTLTKDDIDGATLITAKFMSTDLTKEYDGDCITVRDVTDRYQVIVSDTVYVADGGSVSIQPKLFDVIEEKEVTEGVSFAFSIVNNYTGKLCTVAEMGTATINPTTNLFTWTENEMTYKPSSEDDQNWDSSKTAENQPDVEYDPIIIFQAYLD